MTTKQCELRGGLLYNEEPPVLDKAANIVYKEQFKIFKEDILSRRVSRCFIDTIGGER